MSYLEYRVMQVPAGWRKILHLNWPMIVVLAALSGIGLVALYSVAGGSAVPWARAQAIRLAVGWAVFFAAAFTPPWFWRSSAGIAWAVGMVLLLAVEVMGAIGMGAQRWIDLGPFRLQPSEVMKVALVLALAAYYDALPAERVSRPLWVLVPLLLIALPALLILRQPDLGTALILVGTGAVMMFLAGVSWWYFAPAIAAVAGSIAAVFASRGTPWQLLKDYQYRRIDVFLDPSLDPLGAGYNITQAKIALGSGGLSGRGFLQGTQSQLNFVPEKHTDFILTTFAEEFGFVGSLSLLALFALLTAMTFAVAWQAQDRFCRLMVAGLGFTFFTYFFVNMGMVTGLLPVVGVPLPLVSYGGSAALVIMLAFGLVQSAHVHRPRPRQ
ncbi:MAG: rod shape-determining protein RodA [Alphaproteobacteria bacterium]|nr:MAG: rod shape-determining protein RodA [Alphaproteobacteria bacterium]